MQEGSGCAHKSETEKDAAGDELFCVLTVVVNTRTCPHDNAVHTQTHTQRSPNKAGERAPGHPWSHYPGCDTEQFCKMLQDMSTIL